MPTSDFLSVWRRAKPGVFERGGFVVSLKLSINDRFGGALGLRLGGLPGPDCSEVGSTPRP